MFYILSVEGKSLIFKKKKDLFYSDFYKSVKLVGKLL